MIIKENRGILFAFLGTMLLAGALYLLSGCYTVEGAGKDVQAIGETVTNTSRSVRE